MKNLSTKRLLACVLAAAMMLTLMAGCGGSTASSAAPSGSGNAASGAAGDKLKISMMYNDNPSYPFDANWEALQLIQEMGNVELDIQAIPNQDYDSKVRVLLNSGNIPDFVTYVTNEVYTEFADTGLLLNISEHMDKFPNLAAKIEAYDIEDEIENWRTKDGSLYGLPFMNEKDMYNTCPAIRMDVLEKYNLEVPTTFDELYTVLKTVKENEPDSLPMANHNGEASLRDISGVCWGIEGSYNGFMYDEATNQYVYADTSDNYKEYIKFMNKLISEGLADPEIYTASLDQWKQKMASGSSVFCYTWVSELAQINADGKKLVGEEFNLAPIAPIEGPGGKFHRAAGRIYQVAIIPASAAEKPYFDELCKFIDWMCYSDEGTVPTTWGIEGKTYEVKDGKKVFTQEVLDAPSIQAKLWSYGASNNNFTQIYPYDWFVKVLNEPLVETFTAEAIEKGWFPPIAKTPKLDTDQREDEKMLLTTVKDYSDQMREQFVFGKLDIDAEWDNYVKTINEKGVTKLLEMYNASLQ